MHSACTMHCVLCTMHYHSATMNYACTMHYAFAQFFPIKCADRQIYRQTLRCHYMCTRVFHKNTFFGNSCCTKFILGPAPQSKVMTKSHFVRFPHCNWYGRVRRWRRHIWEKYIFWHQSLLAPGPRINFMQYDFPKIDFCKMFLGEGT